MNEAGKTISVIYFLSFIVLFFSSLESTYSSSPDVSTYSIVKVNKGSITLDGSINDAGWAHAKVLDQAFHYPWQAIQPPLTEFRAVWDGESIYFSFYAEDQNIVLTPNFETELSIAEEDRVEIFFASSPIDQPVPSPKTENYLPLYYGVEVDALGRVLDFSAQYYRKFNFDWDMPGLAVSAVKKERSYQMEISIPMLTLESLGLIDNGQLRVGVFRGEFTKTSEGVTSKWISWINPKTEQPDFHVNEAFGHFLLSE